MKPSLALFKIIIIKKYIFARYSFSMWPSPLHSAGPVVLSSPAQLVAPVLVARGTLSITTTEIYFEVDEDDPAFKRVDSKVSNLQASVQLGFKAGSCFQTGFSVFSFFPFFFHRTRLGSPSDRCIYVLFQGAFGEIQLNMFS